jgi:hypothetical protein
VPGAGKTIYVQPPLPIVTKGGPWVAAQTVCRPVFWGSPRPGMPSLSTGHDTVDGSRADVTLSGAFGSEVFDGLVVTSDGNALRGLKLRDFNAGVLLYGSARGNELGGAGPGQGLVVGQSIAGVVLHGAGVESNRLVNSLIGLAPDGESSAGNATHGVLVAGGAHDNFIGAPGAGNVIAESAGDGVAVVGGGTRRNRLQGNRIGTNAGGSRAMGNTTGVGIGCGATETLLGGPGADQGNVISGNAAEGVWLLSADTSLTLVQGNRIGLAADGSHAVPNGAAGILVTDGAHDSQIGGSEPGAGNTITASAGPGVVVRGPLTVGHSIRRNRITANAGGGISLEAGGNRELPAPIITSIEDGLIRGLAPADSLVELYSDPGREGAIFEGETRADAAGTFRLKPAAPPRGPNLNALAVDGAGNTSPFGGLGQPPTETPTGGPTPEPSETVAPSPPSQVFFPIVLNGHTLFAKLMLEPDQSVIPMGGIVTLDLKLYGAQDLYGLQITLDFPADVLEVIDEDPGTVGVQIRPGDFPDPSRLFIVENRANNTTGVITYAFTLVEGPAASGDGTIAHIRFRGRGPATARVTFREQMLSNDQAESLPAVGVGATIVVLPPPTGTAPPPPSETPVKPTATQTRTPTNTPPPSDTPTSSATPSITPTPSDTPLPTFTPTPSDTPPPSSTPTPSDTPNPLITPTLTDTPSATDTPTATSTASATRPPTVTPVPTGDACARPLVNPGFETDAAWILNGSWAPRYTAAMAHSGQRSLFLGVAPNERNVYSYSSAWQAVIVPSSARTLAVSAWTFQAAEPGGGPDRQLLLLYDIDPAENATAQRPPVAVVFADRLNVQAWQRRALTLDVSAWRGRRLWLYSSVVNDGFGGRAYMMLDDMEMAFCP